jgi:hypothetical protein
MDMFWQKKPKPVEKKEVGTMANPTDIKREMERSATNLTRTTAALLKERKDRADDNRKKDEIIAARDQEILDLKEQLRKVTAEKDTQGAAVAQGAASVVKANEEAEVALAGS